MKHIILLFSIFIFFLSTLFANKIEVSDAPMKHITVYLKGAEIMHEADVDLVAGNTTIILTGLTPHLISESIQAQVSGDVLLESIRHQMDYLNKQKLSDEILRYQEMQVALNDSISLLNRYQRVYEEEKKMILSNRLVAGTTGLDVQRLNENASFFRNRLTDIEKNLYDSEQQLDKFKRVLVDISKQLMQTKTDMSRATSTVSIVVRTSAARSSKLTLSYTIGNAGWKPHYDIRVGEISEPLQLDYRAQVYQNTGMDWQNVSLSLSTGNPFISNVKPELSTYYLTFNNYYKLPDNQGWNDQRSNLPGISGTITDESGEVLIGASILIPNTSIGTITDFDGKYYLEIPAGYNEIEVNYVGFSNKKIAINGRRIIDVRLDEGVYLSEVVVTGLSRSNSSISSHQKSSKIKPPKEIIPLAIRKHHTSTIFKIETPYSITSGKEPIDVRMISYEIPAEYHYAATPKLVEEAFLIANITSWNQYHLLDGPVNLYLNGIYQGQSALDLQETGDTLSLSIGRDQAIVVSRNIEIDYTSRKTIGLNKKESRGWTTTIKNNKSQSINIIIEDQYPVSKDNKIEVSLDESSSGTIDETTGSIKWRMQIGSGQEATKSVRYTVKSPKNQQVVVD